MWLFFLFFLWGGSLKGIRENMGCSIVFLFSLEILSMISLFKPSSCAFCVFLSYVLGIHVHALLE